MGILQLNFAGDNKVAVAIKRLWQHEPPEGYYLAFSGGKDSVVIHHLAVQAGVKFDAHYNVSPIDPPEIYAFIREHYPDVAWDKHAKGFWKQFLVDGPPMRYMRWCCGMIKEAGGIGRVKMMGVRRAESTMRQGRSMLEEHRKHPGTYHFLPIVDWIENEVWEYIRMYDLPYCHLYDEGYDRLGCVLCPFEPPRITRRNLERFPKVVGNWRRAFERYYQKRIERGTPLSFASSEEYWQWWLTRK